jgi:hypothetical protein
VDGVAILPGLLGAAPGGLAAALGAPATLLRRLAVGSVAVVRVVGGHVVVVVILELVLVVDVVAGVLAGGALPLGGRGGGVGDLVDKELGLARDASGAAAWRGGGLGDRERVEGLHCWRWGG